MSKILHYLQQQTELIYITTWRLGSTVKIYPQLMDGVDYGGVEVRPFDFGNKVGWDTEDWYATAYDPYDTTFTDQSNNSVVVLMYFPI